VSAIELIRTQGSGMRCRTPLGGKTAFYYVRAGLVWQSHSSLSQLLVCTRWCGAAFVVQAACVIGQYPARVLLLWLCAWLTLLSICGGWSWSRPESRPLDDNKMSIESYQALGSVWIGSQVVRHTGRAGPPSYGSALASITAPGHCGVKPGRHVRLCPHDIRLL